MHLDVVTAKNLDNLKILENLLRKNKVIIILKIAYT